MDEKKLEDKLKEQGNIFPEPKNHRFNLYNIIVFVLVAAIVWVVGQFTPGIPDEELVQLIMVLLYIWFGITPPNKKN